MMLFSKPPHERDVKKMKAAIPFMKKIKFFSQREIDEEDYLALSKYFLILVLFKRCCFMNLVDSMNHEYYPKGKVVYQEGEFGHNFYIILMGSTGVFMRDPPDDVDLMTPMKKIKYYSSSNYDTARAQIGDSYEFTKMKPGEAFGQVALMHDKPHSESILCTSNCHFATLSKNKFDIILKRIEQKTKGGWKNFFKSHPIFDDLTLVSLQKLFYLIELKIYNRNQTIFKAGDEVKGFYLIYNGEISLSTKVESKIKEQLNINKFMKEKDKAKEGMIIE